MKYAVINEKGQVVNSIILEDVSQWTPPEGHHIVASSEAGPGWVYADGVFSDPVVSSQEPSNEQKNAFVLAEIADIEAKQGRSLRQCALGKGSEAYTLKDGSTSTPSQDLANLESQIAALRSKLV